MRDIWHTVSASGKSLMRKTNGFMESDYCMVPGSIRLGFIMIASDVEVATSANDFVVLGGIG